MGKRFLVNGTLAGGQIRGGFKFDSPIFTFGGEFVLDERKTIGLFVGYSKYHNEENHVLGEIISNSSHVRYVETGDFHYANKTLGVHLTFYNKTFRPLVGKYNRVAFTMNLLSSKDFMINQEAELNAFFGQTNVLDGIQLRCIRFYLAYMGGYRFLISKSVTMDVGFNIQIPLSKPFFPIKPVRSGNYSKYDFMQNVEDFRNDSFRTIGGNYLNKNFITFSTGIGYLF